MSMSAKAFVGEATPANGTRQIQTLALVTLVIPCMHRAALNTLSISVVERALVQQSLLFVEPRWLARSVEATTRIQMLPDSMTVVLTN